MPRIDKTGMPPGSPIHVSHHQPLPTAVNIYRFTHDQLDIVRDASSEQVLDLLQTPFHGTTWVQIQGLADTQFLAQLAQTLDIHQLILEDILNCHQRPKLEEYEHLIFAVLRYALWDLETTLNSDSQVSMIYLPHVVVSFEESSTSLFNPVVERLKNARGKLRNHGPDYLFYALMDVVVDSYVYMHDTLEDYIFELEEELLSADTDQATLLKIQNLKRVVLRQRKAMLPVANMVSGLIRGDNSLIKETTLPYFRDIEDHALRVIGNLETARELLDSMLDVYLSLVSQHMNEIMKVLTVFAAIFIPLTFLAGVYGMNFKHMPELEWQWGYLGIWGVFILVGVSLLVYFKRRRWL